MIQQVKYLSALVVEVWRPLGLDNTLGFVVGSDLVTLSGGIVLAKKTFEDLHYAFDRSQKPFLLKGVVELGRRDVRSDNVRTC